MKTANSSAEIMKLFKIQNGEAFFPQKFLFEHNKIFTMRRTG